MRKQQEKKVVLSHQERRLVRYKGFLPCEWCGRWTEAVPGHRWGDLPALAKWVQKNRRKKNQKPGLPVGSYSSWEDFADAHRYFACKRDRCITGRPETM